MNSRTQIICAWSGILCMVAMFTGLWPAAAFFPPPSPTQNAQQVVAFYQEHVSGIRLATILIFLAGALSMPYIAAISAQMRRIESPRTPVLTYLQLSAGTGGALLFAGAALFWTVAAFRLDRAPEITQALNDLGWLCFLMNPFMGIVDNFAIGFAIIGDKRARPVFPRWVGYFNFWSALLFLPGCLTTYFKTGPFAWDGLLVFWLPATIFGAWFVVMVIYVIKAARQQAADGE